jgi:hypothetical protein
VGIAATSQLPQSSARRISLSTRSAPFQHTDCRSQSPEAFVVFSQHVPSQQSLGFIVSQAAEVEVSIDGRDLTIRQSRGLLTSDRKQGTTGAGLHCLAVITLALL